MMVWPDHLLHRTRPYRKLNCLVQSQPFLYCRREITLFGQTVSMTFTLQLSANDSPKCLQSDSAPCTAAEWMSYTREATCMSRDIQG